MPYTNVFDSEIISALDQVEQAAGSLWTLIDDATTLFAEHENAQDDVASHLKVMRRSYASSLQVLHRLQEFQRTVCDVIEQFAKNIGRFENHISHTALNYGLNLLPDDVLSEIFVLSATGLEEKVALSLVCKRFRSFMMSMRKMWDGYWIESHQSPEQIISIAEGNKFVSLKARICSPSPPNFVETWVAKRGLDLDEYMMRYYKFSVGLILSFCPEELEIDVNELCREEVKPILIGGNMQNVRSLVMLGAPPNPAGARLLEIWHVPHLQNLEVEFVPGSTVAKNLVRFSLDVADIVRIDSLKEFLAAAKSLQDLHLFLHSTARFYEVCDFPSIRSLEVDFEPHPSLARYLVRFRLSPPSSRILSLSRLLDFLSSSEALQELAVRGIGYSEDRGTTDALPVVTMPSVVSCKFLDYNPNMGLTLIAKLCMPMVRTLELNLSALNYLPTNTRNEFRTSLQSMSSLEDLEVSNERVAIDDIDEIIRYAPPHLESLSVASGGWFTRGVGSNTSPVPRRNLIRFKRCVDLGGSGPDPGFMLDFIDYLRTVRLGRVKLQLSAWRGWRDGTFELDDVMSARVDT